MDSKIKNITDQRKQASYKNTRKIKISVEMNNVNLVED